MRAGGEARIHVDGGSAGADYCIRPTDQAGALDVVAVGGRCGSPAKLGLGVAGGRVEADRSGRCYRRTGSGAEELHFAHVAITVRWREVTDITESAGIGDDLQGHRTVRRSVGECEQADGITEI